MHHSGLSFLMCSVVVCSATAAPIELEFLVDNFSVAGSAPSENLQPFTYKVFVEASSALPNYSNSPDGSSYGGISFSMPEISLSPLSDVMLSHVAPYGLTPFPGAGLNRQYHTNDAYFDPPITFQGISFETFASSQLASDPQYPGMITSASYQRGIQKQGSLGIGNSVQAFDANSFVQYMRTLIGDNTFQFQDAALVSSFDPKTNSGNTVLLYGYFGRATLTNVTTVPEPSGYLLSLIGLFVIASGKLKRKNSGSLAAPN